MFVFNIAYGVKGGMLKMLNVSCYLLWLLAGLVCKFMFVCGGELKASAFYFFSAWSDMPILWRGY